MRLFLKGSDARCSSYRAWNLHSQARLELRMLLATRKERWILEGPQADRQRLDRV